MSQALTRAINSFHQESREYPKYDFIISIEDNGDWTASIAHKERVSDETNETRSHLPEAIIRCLGKFANKRMDEF